MNIKKHRIRIIHLFIASAIVLPFLISPKVAKASSGDQLSLSPSSQSVTTGSNLVVSVVIDPGGDSINSVQTIFTYSATNYSLVSIVPGSSFTGAFTNTASSGSIQFVAGTTGSVTSMQTAATITLHATNTGTSSMSLTSVCPSGIYVSCSAAYDSTTDNNDLSSVSGGSYTVTAPPVAPTPSPAQTTTQTTTPKSNQITNTKSSSTSSTHSTTATSTSATTPSPTTTPAVTLTIAGVKISNITATSANITWQTNIAANSKVEYGLTSKYGATAQSSEFTTNHSLMLSNPNLKPSTVYYYQIQSATSSGESATSDALQFTTASLTIDIRVLDVNNRPVAGSEVIVDGQMQTTNGSGIASFQQIPLGTQKVKIVSGNKVTDQTITIGKPNSKTGGYTLQKFNLVSDNNKSSIGLYIILAIGILIVVAVLFLPQSPFRLRRLLHNKDITPTPKPSIKLNKTDITPFAATDKDDNVSPEEDNNSDHTNTSSSE